MIVVLIPVLLGRRRQMNPFSLFAWLSGAEPDTVLTVRLYTARHAVIVNPVIADFTECAFTGYFRPEFPPASFTQFLTNGAGYLQFPALYWRPSFPVDVGPNILGIFTVATRKDGSTFVLGWNDFKAPVDLNDSGFCLIEQFAATAQQATIDFP